MFKANREYLFTYYYESKWMPPFCNGYGHWTFGN